MPFRNSVFLSKISGDGWKPGVASNVGIKSGTNSIHGTAFAVGQTSRLNARNPFSIRRRMRSRFSPISNTAQRLAVPSRKISSSITSRTKAWSSPKEAPSTHKTPTTALIASDATNSIPAAYLDMKAKGQIASAAIDANGKVINSSLLQSPAAAKRESGECRHLPNRCGSHGVSLTDSPRAAIRIKTSSGKLITTSTTIEPDQRRILLA